MRFKPASPLKPLAQHIMFELGVNDSTPEDPLIHADDLKESSNRSDFVFIDPHGEPELPALLLQQLSSLDRADDFFTKLP